MRLFLVLVLVGLVSGPAPAFADGTAVFDIRIRGIPVGVMRLAGLEAEGFYAARAEIESVGVARVFRRFSYRASVRGDVDDGDLTPLRYEEIADTGRRRSEAVLIYAEGVPSVSRFVSQSEPPADSPAPATQGGTLDPLSALFSVLRDRPPGAVCGRQLIMFDGRRRSSLTLGPAQDTGDGVACDGEYRRLQGFTDEELSRHRAFEMQLFFAPNAAGLQQSRRIAVQSVYGLATLDRR